MIRKTLAAVAGLATAAVLVVGGTAVASAPDSTTPTPVRSTQQDTRQGGVQEVGNDWTGNDWTSTDGVPDAEPLGAYDTSEDEAREQMVTLAGSAWK